MSSHSAKRLTVVTAIVIVVALIAGACSSKASNSSRSASAAAGNPVDLPALSATSASGQRVPSWYLAEVTPSSWVSTSLIPTLVVPGGVGGWTFKLSDLSDGTSSFGTRTYAEVGASTRVPTGTLENGNTYSWVAESPGQATVGGSFTVDVQMLAAQQVDSAGGVEALLSSGEAAYTWNSHTMQALGAAVGVSLRFQASNSPSPGMPSGWKLTSSSGSPYLSVVSREDGSVGLVAQNGQVSSYRHGAGSAWNPVRMAGDGLNTSGLAPVLIQNSDGSWSVTSKSSTARFVDDNGDGTANLAAISSDGAPVLQQEWNGGLLRKVIDPVSGRSVELLYGGGTCPKPVSGFVAAPAGLLCQVKFWDGSTSAVSYVQLPDGSTSIGRLTDFPEAGAEGAQVADLAYDAAGRLARTRSPLVAAAAASSLISADDTEFFAEVAYQPDGRIRSLTEPAPSKGGTRCSRSFTNEGTASGVTDSCLGKVVTSLIFDGTTFFPLTVTDVTGRVATNTWNFTTGELLTSVDATGRITENTYEHGNLVRSVGPSRDLSTAPITLHEYDESYAQLSAGVPMRGLDVVYWPSIDNRGADAVQELGPLQNGALVSSLTENWETSPAGNRSGGWSGLMTGTLEIAKPGSYSFASGNSDARVRVANLACENNGCAAMQLPSGPVSIRVEIQSETPDASIDITWAGPDTGDVNQSIPTDRLRPQYGLATESTSVDPTAVRSNRDNINRTSYENPSKGMVAARTNGAGTESAISYEGAGWNRPTASVLPAGNRIVQTWWGDRESAAAPCPGAKSAVQGGAAKKTVNPGSNGGDGPSVQQWYSNSGALVGSKVAGGATSCITYDRGARKVRSETLGLGEKSQTDFDYAVNGNPLISSTTETQGDSVATTVVEVDLAGRIVRSVDRNGIITLTTYDARTGLVASTTSTPPGGPSVLTSLGYDEFARPVSTTIDGQLESTVRYGELGLPVRVTYGNGAVTDFTVDAQNNLINEVSTVGQHSYVSTRAISSAGLTSSSTLSADGRSSTFDYTHDANGRLSAVSLSAGLAAEARSWTYTYDANSNRVAQTVTIGTRTEQYTSTYDAGDRLVSTTDPSAAGISYDDRGNALTVGGDSFTYDAANLLKSATDGSTTVTYMRSASGSIIGKTTVNESGTTTVRYGAGGFVLDDRGQATLHISSLPGGVQLTRRLGAENGSEWTFTTVRGDRFVTLNAAGSLVGTVSMFTPFGELVAGAETTDGSRPDLSWKATEGNETIALRTPVVAMGQRVYVPSIGRFIQVDPVVGGSANSYDYANQDPTIFTDPSGLETNWWVFGGIMAVAVGVVSLGHINVSEGTLTAIWGAVAGAGVGLIVAGAINYATSGNIAADSTTTLVSVLACALLGGIAAKVAYVRYNRVGATAARQGGAPRSQADALIDAHTEIRPRQGAPKAEIRAAEAAPQPGTGSVPQAQVSAHVSTDPPLLLVASRNSVRSSTGSIANQSRSLVMNEEQELLMDDFMAMFTGRTG